MSILDLRTGDLEPTATYSARSWRFIPADGETIGKLTIVCDHAKRNKIDVDDYDVIPTSGPAVELAHRETGEVYAVTISPPSCTCKAAQCRLDCKHVAALADLERAEPGTLTRTADLAPCF